jgi:catechol 2,3-dioxygenase-like lactoylglutathione lyase family enzyme
MNNSGVLQGLCLALIVCGGSAVAWSQQSGNGVPGTSPGPVTGLIPDHAALSVVSLEREADWYQRVLGFKVLSRSDSDPDYRNWHMAIPGYRIDLIQSKGSKRRAVISPAYQQLGWVHVVFHVGDVPGALRTLRALQVEVQVKKDDTGIPIQLRFMDPEGNELEIRRDLML